jgi:LCP family protein required for cell wall assembly
MRTTLKRAVGRVPGANGTGFPAYPLSAAARVVIYRADAGPGRSRLRRLTRTLALVALALLALILGAAGGVFLWFDKSVAAVQVLTPALSRAEKELSIPLPGRPAVALVIGVDSRDGVGQGSDNTDAMMLVRADPATKTISLLSFPRDLNVPIYCSGSVVTHNRINDALATCGPRGVLETVAHLTNVPINYLITVDFHGFKKIVNEIGGIWIDVDRTYYNKNVGTAATDYSNIDLQPGYQLLGGGAALAFVRFRHTDSDLYRLAREQEFVRAVKEQVADNFNPLRLPGLVSAVTSNIHLASKTRVSDSTVLEYALFGATLPAGHVYQVSISAAQLSAVLVGGADELGATPQTIEQAVSQFEHPEVVGAQAKLHHAAAAKAAPRVKAPPVSATTLTVLNGNGVPGAAAIATDLLHARGYPVLPPPGGALPNAPSMNYAETEIYFDPAKPTAPAAADSLARLIGAASVKALPPDRRLRALDPKAMLVVVLGHSFTGRLTPTPAAVAREATADPPAAQATAKVQSDPSVGRSLLAPLARKLPFALETPTVLESTSQPDDLGGDQPVRLYPITKGHKAVRLVFVTGASQYWGIEETDWSGAPVLGDDNLQRTLKGRTYDLYYTSGQLHMVVLRVGDASYWVVNSLLNSLSNATMIAIAEGLRPLGSRAS